MATPTKDNVDYRLLNRMSNLVICSSCLRSGKVTPVPQIISDLRPPTNVCPTCRAERTPGGIRRPLGKLLQFPR
ncbi:MAG: hypothetical protein QNJ00_15740 [Woeseiaceae bacterium]|nr:hypothetical protein [Woeseiaceae bacterium]